MSTDAQSPAVARHQEVTRLIQSGDFKSAAAKCAQLTAEFPQFLPGWHSASFIALCVGQLAAATDFIQRALAVAPADPRYLLQNARCLSAQQRRADSLDSASAAERAAANDAPLLDAIGSFYSSIGEYSRALTAYSAAITSAPARALFWFNRATVRRFLGQLEEAEADYDRVIALRADDYEAYFNRSELRKQSHERNHVITMEQLLTRGTASWRGEMQLRYALAKECEDLEAYSDSWRHLTIASKLRRQHLQYDVRQDVDTVDWIIEAFPAAPREPIQGCPSRAPIFIVGLPRSGTTLVERILGSHSEVFAAGELNHFAAALVAGAQAANGGRPLPRRQLVAATRDLDFVALGADYMRRARPESEPESPSELRSASEPGLSGELRSASDSGLASEPRAHNESSPRFTDKMPLNYLYCGLIRRALPNARIVHVRRHPMASCYAMFKTLFRDGYPFSYDLGDVVRYYAAYRRLMDHWRQSMPGVIYDISYEDLVTDQEHESRRLIEACGLGWQDACLQFHRNPSATTTASASQVRRPIYDSSRAQWRHYDPQLEGLRTELAAAGIDREELI